MNKEATVLDLIDALKRDVQAVFDMPEEPPVPEHLTLVPDSGMLAKVHSFTVRNLPPTSKWGMWVGSKPDANDYDDTGRPTTTGDEPLTVTGWPMDGSEVYIRVAELDEQGEFTFTHYTFTTKVAVPTPPPVEPPAEKLPAGWPAVRDHLANPTDLHTGKSQPTHLAVLLESTGVPFRRISDASQGYPWDHDVHKYSKLPAYSASGDWIEIGGCCNPTATMARGVPFSSSSASTWGWHNDSHYGFDYNTGRLHHSGPNNSNRTLLRDFGAVSSIGQGEGTLSADDRYVVIVTAGLNQVYDIQEDKILNSAVTVNRQNWTSVSLSGDYVVAEENDGSLPRRWWRYDRDMQSKILLAEHTHGSKPHVIEHSAFVLDEYGDDWLVSVGSPFSAVRLRDAARLIFSDGFLGHASGGLLDPGVVGWCAVNENSGRVAAIRIAIDGGPVDTRIIETLGYKTTVKSYNATNEYVTFGLTRSDVSTYKAQAQASISRDGKRLVYTSRWYKSAAAADYEMDLS